MCGICHLFRCGNRRNSCGCTENAYESVCVRRTEPRMNVHCASGIGTASETPCGLRERRNCGCGCGYTRDNDCDYGHNHENDCDTYYENPYCD